MHSSFYLPIVLAANVILPFRGVTSFSSPAPILLRESSPITSRTHFAKPEDNDDEEEEDWRAFRAKLVMSENKSSTTSPEKSEPEPLMDDDDLDGFGALFAQKEKQRSLSITQPKFEIPEGFTPLDPSQWAYDSGGIIEKGAVILGGAEQDFGFGLRQQYFHKAVILVLDHDEETFTKGIILNRPSEKVMSDDDGNEWSVWFGGDVQGLDSILPDIVCLHSLKGEEARSVSETVMKDIQWTTFANAKTLVKSGAATIKDFWLFAGYAGWGPNQLSGELERRSWYMCATDSQTLLKELARQSSGVDPRDAGLETWELLMNMIGRGDTAREVSGKFDDLMLKEWGRGNLLLKGGEYGDIGVARNPLWGAGIGYSEGDMKKESIDGLMKQAKDLIFEDKLKPGTLLRASSAERSPFLLHKQEFHKSLVLIVVEDEKATVGLMINHPAAKGCEIKRRLSTGHDIVPIRYGGDFSIKGTSPVMWLHCNQQLRDWEIGKAFGENANGIYACTQEEAANIIADNVASPEDFLIVSGLCVWPKLGGSLGSEVKRGIFEIVPAAKVEKVFGILQKQEVNNSDTLARNFELSLEAWEMAASEKKSAKKQSQDTLTMGIGEGFDEEDDSVVFNSSKKVADLADDALKKWIATFLLGSPTLA